MFDISTPLKIGDSITFKNKDGQIVRENIALGFWQDRPKGGKEFCYSTDMGNVVPLSQVIGSIQEPSVVDENLFDFQSEHEKEIAHIKAAIENSNLDAKTKVIMLFILEDDIEHLGLAKEFIDLKLKSLRKLFLQNTKELKK